MIGFIVAIFGVATWVTIFAAFKFKRIIPVIITAILAAIANEALNAAMSNHYSSIIIERIAAQLFVGSFLFFLLKRGKRIPAIILSLIITVLMIVVLYSGFNKGKRIVTDARSTVSTSSPNFMTNTPNFPDNLLYDGKPINPECVRHPSQDFSTCGIVDGITQNNEQIRSSVTEGSVVTSEYKCLDGMSCGFFSYEYIGFVDDGVVIKTTESGGGTGIFTSIGVYKRDNNKLFLVRKVTGGDRCRGGIDKVDVHEGEIYYTSHLTALGLFDRFKPDRDDLQSFKALEDCYTCCYAKINIRDNKIQSVELEIDNPYLSFERDSVTSACFNRFISRKISTGENHLSVSDASMFMWTVSAKCVEETTNHPTTVSLVKEAIQQVNVCAVNYLLRSDNQQDSPDVSAQKALASCSSVIDEQNKRLVEAGTGKFYILEQLKDELSSLVKEIRTDKSLEEKENGRQLYKHNQ